MTLSVEMCSSTREVDTAKTTCVSPEIANFNLPRISSNLERLIGSNTVHLTDYKFMSELREHIETENRLQLQKRVDARALREIERERLLIIEGKSDEIPEELADDPIFIVNKIANVEIQRIRAKLKTNREKNSERLKAQGFKWENERKKYIQEEKDRIERIKERKKEQKILEEAYLEEDAERGMDLLRIQNEDWRDCEENLRKFLEEERAKMKARSLRVPEPFTSDKLDVLNVVRARKRFREMEQRMRAELEAKAAEEEARKKLPHFKPLPRCKKYQPPENEENKEDQTESTTEPQATTSGEPTTEETTEKEPKEQELKDIEKEKRDLDDVSLMSIESESYDQGSTISASKARRAAELEQELEHDVERGYLISKGQYEQLRYQDEKIMMLQQAGNMLELYRLAEEIIIGERVEDEVVEEEAFEEEEADYEEEQTPEE